MAGRPQETDYQGYDSPKFDKIANDLHKTSAYEIKRAKSTISKLNGGGASFNMHDQNDIQADIKALVDSKARFAAVMKSLHAGKNVTVKDIENSYDSYCYALGMLGSHIDMWETVIASGIIKTAVTILAFVATSRERIKANGKRLEKDIKALKKLLDKAERAKYGSYIKAGLSLALDVATVLSPQVRALSAISKFAIGGLIDVGSNMLVGKPEDFIGTTIGLTTSGTELEYMARGLTKGADALGKAGKAMKIAGLVGSASEIKEARKVVDQINAMIKSMRSSLAANASILIEVGKTVETAKRDIRNLLKRLQANATKADNATATYQKLKALRAKI